MSAVKEVFSILAARAEEAIPVRDCDYTDKATGLLICGSAVHRSSVDRSLIQTLQCTAFATV